MRIRIFALSVFFLSTALIQHVAAVTATERCALPFNVKQLPDSTVKLNSLNLNHNRQDKDLTLTLPGDTTSTNQPDTTNRSFVDTTLNASASGRSRTNSIIKQRSIIELLSIPITNKVFSWKLNEHYLEYEQLPVDTSLWFNHLFYPQQKRFESYTFLGNIGSPSMEDHFFSRDDNTTFLFSRYYNVYARRIQETPQYNVRSPYTSISYTSAGKRSEAEQLFNVLHTQNVNKHINIGVAYNHIGTKGVYENQHTRNNLITVFGSYHKGNLFGQGAFASRVYSNEENGGIQYDNVVPGDTLETKLIPIWLPNAKSITRETSLSALIGYTFINIKEVRLASDTIDKYIPLVSAKLQISRERHSRAFVNTDIGEDYFSNSFFSNGSVYDSIALTNWNVKAILEINQFANIPGMPGLRGWVGYTHSAYHMFKPQDYIFGNDDTKLYSAHAGVAAFSESPYLAYRGAARVFFSGDKAEDKEIRGEMRISFWKDPEMPQLKGKVLVSESTPDIFYRTFFSNHFKWDSQLEKEKRFQLGASFEIDKWATELGYNVIHIGDYVYFNSNSLPSQASDVTITSAYAQKNFRFFNGFNFFNKVVWQANTNKDVLSLPSFIGFSALFYETVLVPGALSGQFGVNLTYRSNFFADAYNPVTGQFYNQREVKLGDYPTVDVFANFKWKRAIIFVKYEHLNQGYPNNSYYSAYSYPINPQIFKFGVSWIFYD